MGLEPIFSERVELHPFPNKMERMNQKTNNVLPHLLYLPEKYENSEQNWPLIMCLHGIGERGTDLEQVKVHGLAKHVAAGENYEFIIASPQCPAGVYWEEDKLKDLLDTIIRDHNVDLSRMYLTGLSMGGYGTWRMARFYPDLFAAIAPICGWGEPDKVTVLKNLPIWAFHGAKDDVIPLSSSQELVDSVKAAGGSPRLTVYPELEHDSWSITYENPELFRWFLQHQKDLSPGKG